MFNRSQVNVLVIGTDQLVQTKQISLQTGVIGANISVLSWLGCSNKQRFQTTGEQIMSHKSCQSNI